MTITSEVANEITTTIEYLKKHKSWQIKYDKSAPKAGDLAPDFTLLDARGENTVTLSDFRGQKPVALVFGSYT